MTVALSEQFHRARRQNGYSQRELAGKAGVSANTIFNLEKSDISVGLDNAISVAKALGMDLALFVPCDTKTIITTKEIFL